MDFFQVGANTEHSCLTYLYFFEYAKLLRAYVELVTMVLHLCEWRVEESLSWAKVNYTPDDSQLFFLLFPSYTAQRKHLHCPV